MKQAQVAIAILIDLAEKGEIDPWDVQVIEVIDRFLSSVDYTDQDRDLSQSGQAFLWASMLILLKANTLSMEAETESTDGEAIIDEEDFPHQQYQRSLPLRLENHLHRRTRPLYLQKRRVTLPELIEQIVAIAAEIEKKPSISHARAARLQSRKEAASAITQLAHQENLTEVATFLEKFLLSDLSPQATDIDLSELLDLLASSREMQSLQPHSSTNTPYNDKVGVFWALLLLSSQSKVELFQENFYENIKIRTIN